MNKKTKLWLAAGVALILIGVLLFAGVMAGNHWNFAAVSGGEYETRTFDILESFEHISVRTDTADLQFLPSETGTCRMVCQEPPNAKHATAVEDRTLLIELEDTRTWFEKLSLFSFASPKLTVYLPEREYASLVIDDDTGNITIPNDFTFGSIRITAGTGDVDCGASTPGQTGIETSTGDIRMQGVSAGELALSVSTGRVELASVACAGELRVTVSTGKAALTDVACRSLVSGGSTGDLTLEDVVAAERISIRRSTGDVDFVRCDAAELDIQTDTGDVTGSLLTEKVFLTKTDTGRVRVPETTAGGPCRITTDTGDISVRVGRLTD